MGRRFFIIIGSIVLLAILATLLSPFLISYKPNVNDIVVMMSHDEESPTVLAETLNNNISLTGKMQIDIQNNICYITPKIKNRSFIISNSKQSYELDIDTTNIDAVYWKSKNNETQLLWIKEIN